MHYITVVFYRNHEWFKKDLPGYLFPSPTGSDASFIDIDAVDEVCEVNCTHTEHIPLISQKHYVAEIHRH